MTIAGIDLSPRHLALVEAILAVHVPGCEVRAYGSRVKGSAGPWSDLDLAVLGQGSLDSRTLAQLKAAFEESTLLIRVDVLDWRDIPERFREEIGRDYVVLQEAAQAR